MVEFLCRHQGPAFLRTTRQKLPRVHAEGYQFKLGALDVLRAGGKDVLVFATGGEVGFALEAAEQLARDGLDVGVVNVPCLKPFDAAGAAKLAAGARLVVTAEDHTIIGGLGSVVAEAMAESGVGRKLVRVGLQDVFGESGAPAELLRKHQLDADGIAAQVRAALR